MKWNRARSDPEGGEKNKRDEVISRSDCHLVTKVRVWERIIYRVTAILSSVRQARGTTYDDWQQRFHREMIVSLA